MKYGNSMNQPVIDLRTQRCYITPKSRICEMKIHHMDKRLETFISCKNANDHSNEGSHPPKLFFSVIVSIQKVWIPDDTEFLFQSL